MIDMLTTKIKTCPPNLSQTWQFIPIALTISTFLASTWIISGKIWLSHASSSKKRKLTAYWISTRDAPSFCVTANKSQVNRMNSITQETTNYCGLPASCLDIATIWTIYSLEHWNLLWTKLFQDRQKKSTLRDPRMCLKKLLSISESSNLRASRPIPNILPLRSASRLF